MCLSLSAVERAIESESSRKPGQNVMFQTSVIVDKEEVTIIITWAWLLTTCLFVQEALPVPHFLTPLINRSLV